MKKLRPIFVVVFMPQIVMMGNILLSASGVHFLSSYPCLLAQRTRSLSFTIHNTTILFLAFVPLGETLLVFVKTNDIVLGTLNQLSSLALNSRALLHGLLFLINNGKIRPQRSVGAHYDNHTRIATRPIRILSERTSGRYQAKHGYHSCLVCYVGIILITAISTPWKILVGPSGPLRSNCILDTCIM